MVCVNCVFISHSITRSCVLESKISGTISFAQWWVLDLTLEPLRPLQPVPR